MKRAKLGIMLSILLVALEAVSVKSSPFLPSTRHFTVRGGGAFGRKSSVPSASILVDDFVSQLDGKV